MTLQEFFDYLSDRPELLLAYFIGIPILALVAGWLDKEEGHYAPWNYIYAIMIYCVCIPGIFAVTLSVYLFLFENHSILSTNLYTQVLPVGSMIATLLIIKQNVILDYIPGFDRLSGLIMLISAALAIMWFIDRLRLIAFTFIPFQYVLIFLIVLIATIRFGWSRIIGRQYRSKK